MLVLIITCQLGVFLYFLFMLGMAVYSVSKAVSARAKLRPEVRGYTNTLYPDSGLLPHPAAEGGDVSCYGGEDGLPQDHSLLPRLLQQTEVGGHQLITTSQ